MRFLASGFLTPSHDVVPTCSKSSTLNLDVDVTKGEECQNWAHFNVFTLDYAGIGFRLDKPMRGPGHYLAVQVQVPGINRA
jgi:hypothetical protein